MSYLSEGARVKVLIPKAYARLGREAYGVIAYWEPTDRVYGVVTKGVYIQVPPGAVREIDATDPEELDAWLDS